MITSNNANMKKFAQKKYRKRFLEAIFFAFEKTFLQRFFTKFLSLLYMRSYWPTKFLIVFLQIVINLHWCYTFCTGIALFALVLHLKCTALSQSESSNFLMCIINLFILEWCYGPWFHSERHY